MTAQGNALVVIHKWTMILVSTAKRLHRIAQGCRAAATLGKNLDKLVNPERVPQRVLYQFSSPETSRSGIGRSSEYYGTLSGFTCFAALSPRVAATQQPWAILFNRFAVGGTPELMCNNEGVALGCRMSVFQT